MKNGFWVAASLLAIVALMVGGCSVTPPAEPKGMESPRQLTEKEKVKVIEVALNTPEVLKGMEEESEINIGLMWVAVGHGRRYFNYDDVETDPNRSHVPESAVWYPDVAIWFGEPVKSVLHVAVDLEIEQAVSVTATPTVRNGPGN